MLRRIGLLTTLLLVALAACGNDDDSSSSGTPSGERADTHVRVEPPEAQVELLDAGAEPRQELRLDLDEGDSSPLEMEMTIAQRFEATGMSPTPEVEITILMDAEMQVLTVADGIAEVEVTYLGARVVDADALMGPAEIAAMEAEFEELTGQSIVTGLDDRGRTVWVDMPTGLDQAESPDELLFDTSDLPSFPFPEEPVGPGARWVVTAETADDAPIGMTLTTEYLLVEADEHTIVVEQVMDATMEPGRFEADGQSADLLSGTISATGTSRWDLDRPMPDDETSADMAIALGEEFEGERLEVRLFIRMGVTTSIG